MADSCDVIVIGGGPGGSSVATFLAQGGLDVVLLERTQFPREHVGESLLPGSVPILEKLGVMPAIEAAGFVTKRGATMVWGSEPDPWSWRFDEIEGVSDYTTSFQVVRSQFDALLLDNARQHGVDVREGHQVLEVEFEGARASGVRFRAGPTEGSLQARFVVDASGQAALLSRKLKLQRWDPFFQNLAVYGYYRDARQLEPPDDGNIFIEAYSHGWLWMIPLHTGAVSVGAVLDKDVGQAGLRDLGPRALLAAQIDQAPHLRDRLQRAQLIAEPQVARDWSYTSSSIVGEGYVLVGDAASFIDPLFSSGVHLALHSARLAAAYIRSVFADPEMGQAAGEAYTRLYEQMYQYFQVMVRLFYSSNRTADSYFWEARRQVVNDDSSTPREAFVRAVSGHPPQGYERAVLERGEAPAGILAEVRDVDDLLDQRRRAITALAGHGGEGLQRLAPSLEPSVQIERQPVLADNIFEWSFVLTADGLASPIPVAPGAASLVAKIDGTRTIGQLIRAMQAENAPEVADAIAQNVIRTLPELYVGGVVRVTVPGVGRNDDCPCESGKKYKRCHALPDRDQRVVDYLGTGPGSAAKPP